MSRSGHAMPELGTDPSQDSSAEFSRSPTLLNTIPGTATTTKRPRVTLRLILALIWIAVAATATAAGYQYYRTPADERPFVQGHALYAPTGTIGLSWGILGALLMVVGVTMYMARKRIPFMSGWGRMSVWLEVHIFLCTLGPFLVVLHTSFRVDGLVAIAFWSMIAIVASGVFGRFLYGKIPKTVQGQFRTLAAVEQVRSRIERDLDGAGVHIQSRPLVAGSGAHPGPIRSILAALWFDVTKRRRRAAIRSRLGRLSVPSGTRDHLATLMLEEQRIRHQIHLLKPFQRMFRYWHLFHLPLALVMLLILAVHVGVAIAFGYGWPW